MQRQHSTFLRCLCTKASLFTIAAALSACTIADSMQVRKGVDPKHADDDVRFRTTYYFRAVDYCEPSYEEKTENYTFGDRLQAPSEQIFIRKKKIDRIVKDTLYRFTMTGKASPVSKIRFESGTLKSWQIDPFGANIAHDKRNNRFYWKSQSEVQTEGRMSEIFEEIKHLQTLKADLQEANPNLSGDIDKIITSRLQALEISYGPQQPVQIILPIVAQLRKTAHETVTNLKKTTGHTVSDPAPSTPGAADIDPDKHMKDAQTFIAKQVADLKIDLVHLEKVKETLGKAYGEAAKAAGDDQKLIIETANALNEAFKQPGDTETLSTAKTNFVNAVNATKPAGGPIKPDSITDSNAVDPHATKAKEKIKAAETAKEKLDDTNKAIANVSAIENTLTHYLSQIMSAQGPLLNAGQTGDCAPGGRFRRGFQLIGPEGIKTFDQEDRLIMAMSTSAAPVLSALQELSGRMLQEGGPSRSDKLLPLVEERLRLRNTEAPIAALSYTAPDNLEAAIQAVATALGKGE